jgi:hypothetical protein
MNKIKLLYDVVTKMKEKETIKGRLKVEGNKDKVKVFNLENEFDKNTASGEFKARHSMEMDLEGRKMKHEGSIDSNMQMCQRHMHNHNFHNFHEGMKFGFKEKLNHLAFALNVLNNIKVDEKEDKSSVLSLNVADIPEEFKNAIHEKMKQHEGMHEHGGHKGFMKEFHSMDNPNIELSVWINKNSEIEKVLLSANGKQSGESDAAHEMDITAQLDFVL